MKSHFIFLKLLIFLDFFLATASDAIMIRAIKTRPIIKMPTAIAGIK